MNSEIFVRSCFPLLRLSFYKNKAPCNDFVKKSAIINSVGQCLYTTIIHNLYPCACRNNLLNNAPLHVKSLHAISLLSVELVEFSFCLLDPDITPTVPSRHRKPPVWLLMSGCDAYAAYTQHPIMLKSSVPNVLYIIHCV